MVVHGLSVPELACVRTLHSKVSFQLPTSFPTSSTLLLTTQASQNPASLPASSIPLMLQHLTPINLMRMMVSLCQTSQSCSKQVLRGVWENWRILAWRPKLQSKAMVESFSAGSYQSPHRVASTVYRLLKDKELNLLRRDLRWKILISLLWSMCGWNFKNNTLFTKEMRLT